MMEASKYRKFNNEDVIPIYRKVLSNTEHNNNIVAMNTKWKVNNHVTCITKLAAFITWKDRKEILI